jgi:hypothetical protein
VGPIFIRGMNGKASELPFKRFIFDYQRYLERPSIKIRPPMKIMVLSSDWQLRPIIVIPKIYHELQ